MPILDAWIERLKVLGGDRMPEEVAKEVAPLVNAEVKATAAAGTTPLGAPWKPKKGGGRPMPNAADHIQTRALGRVVAVTLTGPDVFHHLGLGGRPRRQVIPDAASIPATVREAFHRGAVAVFRRITGGHG